VVTVRPGGCRQLPMVAVRGRRRRLPGVLSSLWATLIAHPERRFCRASSTACVSRLRRPGPCRPEAWAPRDQEVAERDLTSEA